MKVCEMGGTLVSETTDSEKVKTSTDELVMNPRVQNRMMSILRLMHVTDDNVVNLSPTL